MPNFDLTQTPAWAALQQLAGSDQRTLSELFASDPERVDRYSLQGGGLSLDYSKNRVGDEVMAQLLALAASSPLAQKIEALFCGQPINTTEQRPVLHTALRATPAQRANDGLDEQSEAIARQQARMREFSDRIRNGQWLGATGKPITDIVNLGIGGSDLGPRLACDALKEYARDGLRCHFVSNVDGEVIHSLLKTLDPASTVVIVASKTFTTQETLLNADTAAAWFRQQLGLAEPYGSRHFIAVTASPDNAVTRGIASTRILEFWDWVGGRYSLWSAIGLPIAIAIGYDGFERMLAGARAMDEHFRHSPWERNMPVILALLGIWYNNVLQAESHAVIPYCERLGLLPFYLQQLDMESNGKGVRLDNQAVDYSTGPIIWGLTGTNGQHSFFQLLHQGTHLVPVDFVGVLRDNLSETRHHRVLLANMLAQSAALMAGKQSESLPPYRQYPGNRPSNVLLLDALTPETFGALLALYEHKVFVQGCLWNLNSFDQWGVELGKQLATSLLDHAGDRSALDASTRALLRRVGAAIEGG